MRTQLESTPAGLTAAAVAAPAAAATAAAATAATAAAAVGWGFSRTLPATPAGLYKLNPVYSWLESLWFQPVKRSQRFKVCFQIQLVPLHRGQQGAKPSEFTPTLALKVGGCTRGESS
jgi:hypothetical protein